MIEDIFQKLGLGEKESKIYLACLKLGPSPVRKIASEANINRQTAYDSLKYLIELGLISYHHKDKRQYFIAEDPEKLKDVLNQREGQLKKIKKDVEDIIPQLKSMQASAEYKPIVKFYEGYSGMEFILKDVISSCQSVKEDNYYAFSSSTIKKFLYNVYPDFSKDRIKAGINVKVISIGPGGETRGLDERRWLTKKESAPTYTIIYAGKVAMISVDSNSKPIGVMIEDKNIFETQKMTFEFIWEKL